MKITNSHTNPWADAIVKKTLAHDDSLTHNHEAQPHDKKNKIAHSNESMTHTSEHQVGSSSSMAFKKIMGARVLHIRALTADVALEASTCKLLKAASATERNPPKHPTTLQPPPPYHNAAKEDPLQEEGRCGILPRV